MKILLYILLLVIITTDPVETDLVKSNLKGPVKSVKMEFYGKKNIKDTIASELNYYRISNYNKNGFKTEESLYNIDMSVRERQLMMYDEKMNLIEETMYDAKGMVKSTKHIHDENNCIIQSLAYDVNGELIISRNIDRDDEGRALSDEFDFILVNSYRLTVIQYDDKENTRVEYEYDKQKALKSFVKYVNNDKNKWVEYLRYDKNENLLKRIERKYDNKFNQISKEANYGSDNELKSYVVFTYDNKGHLLKEVTYDKNEAVVKTIKHNVLTDHLSETIKLNGKDETIFHTKTICREFDKFENCILRDSYVSNIISTSVMKIEYYE